MTNNAQELSGAKKLLIAVIILMVLWCSIVFQIYDRIHQPSRIASPAIKARMAFHGPNYLPECDHNGKCQFMNERGQWCKL